MERISKYANHVAIPMLVAAGIVIILVFAVIINNISRTNNAYIRVMNCVLSYNPSVRQQSDIDRCYSLVEKETGIKLEKYQH